MKIKGIATLALLGLALLAAACHRKPRPPALPASAAPAPNYFEQGEQYFDSGDYAEAARAYDSYLRGTPSSSNQNRALFRLAMAYAVPGTPIHDLPRAMTLFKRLVTLFPKSPFAPQAQFVLALHADIERLKSDMRERDERLRRLASELEKLKKIDMERRPTRPP